MDETSSQQGEMEGSWPVQFGVNVFVDSETKLDLINSHIIEKSEKNLDGERNPVSVDVAFQVNKNGGPDNARMQTTTDKAMSEGITLNCSKLSADLFKGGDEECPVDGASGDMTAYIVYKGYSAKRKDEIQLPLGTEVIVLEESKDRSKVAAVTNFGQEFDRGWVPSYCLQLKEEAIGVCSADAEPPKFIKKLESTTAVEGGSVKMMVQVAGFPKPEITWFLDGLPVRNDIHHRIVQDGDSIGLDISEVVIDDEGVYTVKAVNLLGSSQCQAEFLVESDVSSMSGLSESEDTFSLTEKTADGTVVEGKKLNLSFVKGLTDTVIDSGGSVSFHVEIEGDMNATVSWFINGEEIKTNNNVFICDVASLHTMTIQKVSEKHAGSIKCLVMNKNGYIESLCTLRVISKSLNQKNRNPFIYSCDESISVEEDADAEFNVEFSGDPQPEITWYRDRIHLTEEYGVNVATTHNRSKLTLPEVTKDDCGDYQCVAANSQGEMRVTMTLCVTNKSGSLHSLLQVDELFNDEGPPEITDRFEDKTLSEGDPILLQIKAIGNPAPTVTWFHNKNRMEEGVNCKFEHWNQIFRLFIPLCEGDNAGEYTCIVENKYGDVTYSGDVAVNGGIFPPKFFNHTNDLLTQKGQPCQLDAMIKGKPKPLVEWYKDTRALVERNGMKFLQDGNKYSLYIPEVTDSHCGTYKCIAFNSAGESACIFHLKLKAGDNNPPRFWRSLLDINTVCGKTLKLNATIHSKTPLVVNWYKDQRLLDTTTGFTSHNSDDVYSLVKDGITQDDSGTYKCEAINIAGKTSCECVVSVDMPVDLPVFTKGLGDIQVLEYERCFKLEVIVLQGKKIMPEVWFYKNGAVIESGPRRKVYQDGDRHVLELKYVLLDDAGEYVAVASNSNGDMAMTKALLEVLPHNTPPQFLKFTEHIELSDGDDLTLSATIKGHPRPSVDWIKDGISIDPDHNHIIKDEGYVYSLTIPSGTVTETGHWQCLATNKMGQSDVWMRVSFKSSDKKRSPKFLQSLHNVGVGVGETLVLETIVKGDPLPIVKWFKQDKLLTNNKRTVITSNANNGKNILIINRVDINDCGDYECVAENLNGEASVSCEVAVKDLPSKQDECKKDETPQKPTMHDAPSDVRVKEGEELTITFKVTGCPPPMFEILKNNSPYKHEADVVQYYGEVFRLYIGESGTKDDAIYEIIASNEFGQDSCKVEVEVVPTAEMEVITKIQEKRSSAAFKASSDEHQESSTSTSDDEERPRRKRRPRQPAKKLSTSEKDVSDGEISPIGSASPVADSSMIDGRELIDEPTITEIVQADVSAALYIDEISHEKQTCLEWHQQLSDVKATEGEKVVFQVEINGEITPEVQFFVGKRLLQPNERIHFNHVKVYNRYELIINTADLKDTGTYRCIARNKEDVIECSAHLEVQEVMMSPEFLAELHDCDVMENANLTLKVEVCGKPKPLIDWFFDDQLMISSSRVKIRGEDDFNTLQVLDTNTQDSGTYKVVCSNGAGEISSTCNVTVLPDMKAPIFTETPQNISILEQKSAVFHVAYEGKPEPNPVWSYEGEFIEPDDNIEIDTVQGESTLTIKEVELSHSGTFGCAITNLKSSTTCSFHLIVNKTDEEPSFSDQLHDITLKEGETLTFSIEVKGTPAPSITWYRDDKEVVQDERILFTHEKDTAAMTIFRCCPSDAGVFKVCASNTIGSASSTAVLEVEQLGFSPIFEKGLIESTFIEGDDMDISVDVIGVPKPTLRWLKDESDITASSDVSLKNKESIEQLNISCCTFEHSGLYKCIAENIHGTVESSCTVWVKPSLKPPSFRSKPQSELELFENDEFSFEFQVSGNPEPSVEVTRNSQAIDANIVSYILTDGHGLVKISNIAKADEGIYKVVAKNSEGKAVCSIALMVYDEVKFEKQLSDITVMEGEDATFAVEFRGNVVDADWYKDNEYIDQSEKYNIIDEDSKCSCVITKCKPVDSGTYRCEILNEKTAVHCTAKLTVVPKPLAPSFKVSLKDIDVTEGDAATMGVIVYGVPSPQCIWFKDGVEVEVRADLMVTSDEDSHMVVMPSVSPSDSGTYKCTAFNDHGQCECEATLSCSPLSTEPVFTKVFAEETEKEVGDETVLTVIVSGEPAPQVSFMKNGDGILCNDKIMVREGEGGEISLVITNAEVCDSGQYSAIAQNCAGTSSCLGKLLVRPVWTLPAFSIPPQDLISCEGTDVLFIMEVTGIPTPAVTVFFNELLIENLHGIDGKCQLALKSCQLRQSGQYVFEASNDAGKTTAVANLIVEASVAASFEKILDETQCVQIDEDINLQVVAKGMPRPQVRFFKGKNELSSNSPRCTVSTIDGVTQLTLSESTLDDAGTFSCQVQNETGDETCSTLVQVTPKPQPPRFVRKLSDVTVVEGEELRVHAELEGYPIPTVQWIKDETIIETTNTYEKVVELSDSGRYCVVIKNDCGEERNNFTVTVDQSEKAPAVVKEQREMTVIEGDRMVLEVTVVSHPASNVTWYKDDAAITAEKFGFSIEDKPADGRYHISHSRASKELAGNYKVVFSNELGEAASNCQVFIEGKPEAPKFVEKFEMQTVNEEDHVQFSAFLTAKPMPEVKWFKDKFEIKEKSSLEGEGDGWRSVLKLPAVTLKDSGRYKCVAKNSKGEVFHSASLKVKELIHPPEFLDQPEDIFIMEGQPLEVIIRCTGSQPVKTKWTRNGKVIYNTAAARTDKTDNSVSLKIRKTSLNDSGGYVVELQNSAGTKTISFSVKVEEASVEPNFLMKLHDVTTMEGKDIEFNARVTGKPPPEVSWNINGKEMMEDENIQFVSKNDGKHCLILKKVTESHNGTVQCIAENACGNVSSSCKLVVNTVTAKPEFKMQLEDNIGTSGDEILLTAEVSAKPEATITWFKNRKEIKESDRIKFTHTDNKHSLLIASSTVEDSGSYKICARNKVGERSSSAQVTITEPCTSPVFTTPLKETVVETREEVTMSVKAVSQPKSEYLWQRDGIEVKNKLPFIIEDLEDGSTLRIRCVDLTLGGLYSCVASNIAGMTSTEGKLVVMEAKTPPVFTSVLSDFIANEREDIILSVNVNGHPKPNVNFYKENKRIQNIDGISIKGDEDGNWSIVIEDAGPPDSGVYECKAFNDQGEVFCKCNVQVNGILDILKITCDKGKDSITALKGSVAIFEATISGSPETVDWEHEDDFLESNEKYKIHIEEGATTLQISDIDESDAGPYACVVVIDNIEVEKVFTLTVSDEKPAKQGRALAGKLPKSLYGSPPVFSAEPTKFKDVKEGTLAKFTCRCSAVPAAEISWYFEDILIEPSSRYQVKSLDGLGSLTIKSARDNDIGKYKVVAENIVGKCEANFSLKVGGRSTRKEAADVAKTPAAEVALAFHGETGTDKSVRKNSLKTSSSSSITAVELLVDTQPRFKPSLVTPLEDRTVVHGDNVILKAQFRGHPRCQYSWFKGGNAINSDSNMIIQEDGNWSILDIKAAELSDEEDYQCVAENELGSCKTTMELLVDEKESHTDRKNEVGNKVEKEVDLGDDTAHQRTSDLNNKAHNEEADSTDVTSQSACMEMKFLRELPKEHLVLKGSTLHLEVQLSSPHGEVFWERDGEPLDDATNVHAGSTGCVHFLEIHDMQSDDEGDFEVFVEYGENDEISSMCEVYINDGPIGDVATPVEVEDSQPNLLFAVEEKLKPAVVENGETASFFVVLTRPALTYKWLINDKQISNGGKYQMEEDGDRYTLTISSCGSFLDKKFVQYIGFIGDKEASSVARMTVIPATPSLKEKSDLVQERTAGEDITLSVEVKGMSNPHIQWMKGLKPLTHNPMRCDISYMDEIATLNLKNVIAYDSGFYKCMVSQGGKKLEMKFNIKIKAKKPLPPVPTPAVTTVEERPKKEKPSVITALNDLKVVEGQPVLLKAEFQGHLPMNFFWLQDEEPLEENTRKFSRKEGNWSILEITKANTDDEAEYICVAKNELGECKTSSELLVNEKSVDNIFMEELSDVTVMEGEALKLASKVHVADKQIVQWKKNGNTIKATPFTKINATRDGVLSLVIRSAAKTHSGTYTCEVTNSKGTYITTSNVNVTQFQKPLKPFFKRKIQSTTFDCGTQAQFSCTVGGSPSPSVEWKLNGVIVSSEGRFEIKVTEDKHDLIINDCDQSDVGVITCIARNSVGNTNCEAKLAIDKTIKDGLDEGSSIPKVMEKKKTSEFQAEHIKDSVSKPVLKLKQLQKDSKPKPIPETKHEQFRKDNVPKPESKFKHERLQKDDITKPAPECTHQQLEEESLSKLNPESKDGQPQGDNVSKHLPEPKNKQLQANQKSKPVIESKYEQSQKKFGMKSAPDSRNDQLQKGHVSKPSSNLENEQKQKDQGSKPTAGFTKDELLKKEKLNSVIKNKKAEPLKKDPVSKPGSLSEELSPVKPKKNASSFASKLGAFQNAQKASNSRPDFVVQLKETAVHVGRSARFDVEISGSPKPDVTWFKDNKFIDDDNEDGYLIEYEENGCQHSLIIEQASLRDTGKFKCFAKNSQGKATSVAQLLVEECEEVDDEAKREKCEVMTEEQVIAVEVAVVEEAPPMDDKLETEVPSVTFSSEEKMPPSPTLENSDLMDKLNKISSQRSKEDDDSRLGVPPTKNPAKVVHHHEVLGSPGIDIIVEGATPVATPPHSQLPKIKYKSEDLDLDLGDNAEFKLVLEDNAGCSVAWYKETTLLFNSGRIKVCVADDAFCLRITDLVQEDESLYEAKIRNEQGGEIVCDFELLVGDDEEEDDEDEETLSKGDASTSEFTEDQDTDGDSESDVEDDEDDKEEEDMKLEENPQFIKELDKCYNVAKGSSVKLEVEVEGDPDVEWFYEGQKFKSNEYIQISCSERTHRLEIVECVPEDEGLYECVATYRNSEIVTATEIVLKKEKCEKVDGEKEEKSYRGSPQFTSRLVSRQIDVGDVARMDVRVESLIPPTITWYFNHQPIKPDLGHIMMLSDDDLHSLIIEEAQLLDGGLYTCKATTELGETSSSADLIVLPAVAIEINEIEVKAEGQVKVTSPRRPGRPSTGMNKLEEVLSLSQYTVSEDYQVGDGDALSLARGDNVEVLDTSQDDKWLVRKTDDPSKIGFVTPKILKKSCKNFGLEAVGELEEEEEVPVLDDDIDVLHHMDNLYVAVGNYEPKFDNELSLSAGMLVQPIDLKQNQEYWHVRVVNKDGSSGEEGLIPATHVELKSKYSCISDLKPCSSVENLARKLENIEHRNKIMEEMIQTEEKYIEQLQHVTNSHLARIADRVDIPVALHGKVNVVFSNIITLLHFHSTKFLGRMRETLPSYKEMAICFMKYSSDMDKLYVEYCNSRPAAAEVLDVPEVNEFWEMFQHETDDKHPIHAYLITPVQRIMRYELLLKEILKYTTRAEEPTQYIEEALSQISSIIRHANDLMHLKHITGFHEIGKCGKLIKMDTVNCWDGGKAKGKGKERYLFLCDNFLIGAKKKEESETGHKQPSKTQKHPSYAHKFHIKISDLGQTENVDGHPTQWIVWSGKSATTATKQYALEAKTTWEKRSWVRALRDILEKQILKLKGDLGDRTSVAISLFGDEDIAPPSSHSIESPNRSPKLPSKFIHFNRPPSEDVEALRDECEVEEIYAINLYNSKELLMEDKKELTSATTYRITTAPRTKGGTPSLKKGDLVSLIRKGTSLYLVERKSDTAARTWIPGSYLAPLIVKGKESLDNTAADLHIAPVSQFKKNVDTLEESSTDEENTDSENEIRDKIKGVKSKSKRSKPKNRADHDIGVSSSDDEDPAEHRKTRRPLPGAFTSSMRSLTPESEDNIPFGPPEIVEQLADCYVKEGAAAQFVCKVRGNPPPDVCWLKDNEKVVESKQFTMLHQQSNERCVLVISHSNQDDAGVYTCSATNSQGTTSSRAILFCEMEMTESPSSESDDDHVSDPESLPDKEAVEIRKEDAEIYYVMKEELGRGKFGVVNKCIEKSSNCEYAAKFIKCRPTERKNVINEIEIMNSLNHKRLINLIAAFESSRQIVLILDLVTGGELFEKLTEEEYISEKVVTFYMKQVLQAVQHMHQREILHLDLKPENIMLVNQRSTQIKLIDFGLARRMKEGEPLKVLFGTPEFMAPEVINYDHVSTATDMWSIGVITYVLLSGLSPFAGDNDGETLSNVTEGEWDFDDEIFEQISEDSKDFITTLLIKKQKDRATCEACIEHPWLKKTGKQANANKIKTDRLKSFTARRKWKKTITAVRSTNFLTRLLTGIKEENAKKEAKQLPSTPTTPTTPTNAAGPAWKRALDVDDEVHLALEFTQKLVDVKMKVGENALLEAHFKKGEGSTPRVTWKKEGKEIFECKRIKMNMVDKKLTMKITLAQMDDTGRYTVRIENEHGSTECSSQLIVRDVPDPPMVPEIPQRLATSMLVQWRSSFDGNSPILHYQLQYRKSGDKDWCVFADQIKEKMAIVEDLEEESSYRFRVNASNEVGPSAMSEMTDYISTTKENKRNSINAPGATRVSRSLSIRVSHDFSCTREEDIPLKEENPETYYQFEDEIGRGKFAVVKLCTSKLNSETFAAKMVKYDEDTLEVTKKEHEIWKELRNPKLVRLREAFIVRKYLVFICDHVREGRHVLRYLSELKAPTENDVATCIYELLEALEYLHKKEIVHLDVKPGNIMITDQNTVKLIDYGDSRKIITKGGEVGEMVGTAEFIAPEVINFEPIMMQTDMWSVGVCTYALLSGISPFAADDEDETIASITALEYRFEPEAFANVTEEAKKFIRALLIRKTENRPTASTCLQDAWLADGLCEVRSSSRIDRDKLKGLMIELDEQDKLEYIRATTILRTFVQSPYNSPESESEVSDED